MDNQKRKFQRVQYPCSLTIWRQDGSQQVIFATAENVSAGGALFVIDQQLASGTKLDVKMEFQKPPLSFSCQAHVLRCDAVKAEQKLPAKTYALAIQFLDLNDGQKSTLNSFLQQLLENGGAKPV